VFFYNNLQFTDEATYSLPYNGKRSNDWLTGNSGRQAVDGELLFVRKTEIVYGFDICFKSIICR